MAKISPEERCVNLTFALLKAAPSFAEHSFLLTQVPGYDYSPYHEPKAQESARKMLNRDIRHLKNAGVPIEEVPTDNGISYRIQLENYGLPEVHFTAEEATIIALAGQVGSNDQLSTFSRSGWTKIAASGADRDLSATSRVTFINDFSALNLSDFETLVAACNSKHRISFFYQKNKASDLHERWLDPWAIATRYDRLYLVGFDLDRLAPRTFRLTRLSEISILSDPHTELYGTFHLPPAGSNLEEIVEKQVHNGQELITARLRLAPDYKGEFLGLGTHIDKDIIELVDVDRAWLVRTAAAHAPEVVVLSPEKVRQEVIDLLQAVIK
ncbi:Protein pafB [Corynebacterium kutscheri]|uniref:Putative transcriptional regulator n=1 Tax=Corynebacterium kutscheri TaxID=35755 RepID=A0A0F6TDS2_9CORY|nr:WYL domain-containing protein [Corynebacterium kutscheri]AKE41211.1 putative transcriptional regulator [Corynebacterium kutscheri]VEH09533.1 Protein pafB [Corynebacterium kutscheri]VEH79616.1 Protein pafB [Corynebacterium kutscheri]